MLSQYPGRGVFYYDRREVERDALLEVRVTPRASRDEILGWREGILHVRLRAPPVEGRANESLRRLLSERLGVPANAIEVISGLTARRKRVRIRGKTRVEVDEALGAPR